MTQHANSAGGWDQKARNAADRGRFAGAIGSEKAKDLTRRGRDADLADGDQFAILLLQPIDFNHSLGSTKIGLSKCRAAAYSPSEHKDCNPSADGRDSLRVPGTISEIASE